MGGSVIVVGTRLGEPPEAEVAQLLDGAYIAQLTSDACVVLWIRCSRVTLHHVEFVCPFCCTQYDTGLERVTHVYDNLVGARAGACGYQTPHCAESRHVFASFALMVTTTTSGSRR